MKKILLIFLIFSRIISYSQSYIEYSKTRIRVSNHIMDEKFDEAQVCFDSIYNNYDFMYAGDCLMGLKLSIVNNDSINSYKYLLKCLEMGIAPEIINEDSFIKKNLKYDIWENITKNDIDSLRKIYDNRINKELAFKIDSMFAVDQKYTGKANGCPLWFWNFFKWRNQVSKNAKIIKEIIINYGYPGEKLLGIQYVKNMSGDYVIGNKYCPNRFSSYYMLIHYFSNYVKDWEEFSNLLYDQIESGNLRPGQYAAFCDFKARWRKSRKQGTDFFYNKWHYDPDTTRINKVNKRRNEIGISDFDYEKRKFEYEMNITRKRLYDSKIVF